MKGLESEVTRFTAANCPACGHKLDATVEASEGKGRPNPGDYMICFGCQVLLIFGEGLTFRALTVAEARKFARDPESQAEVKAAIAEIRRVKALRN